MANEGHGQRYGTVFLKKLFARGTVYKELFNNVCKAGCDVDTLGGLLCAVCTIAIADHEGLLSPSDISTADLKRLTRDLLSIADLVERVNHTRLNPKLDILAAPSDSGRDPMRKHVAYLYDKLPFVMRLYSFHCGRFSKFSKSLLKRLTIAHLETHKLLLYVEENTGRPRYEDMSNLLTAGFVAAGGTEDNIPDFFSADALAKLKQRLAKFGLTSRPVQAPRRS